MVSVGTLGFYPGQQMRWMAASKRQGMEGPLRGRVTQAPSHRHYPASSVLRASPPPHRPRLVLADSRFGACAPPTGLPVLPPSPSCTHAAANTPAETTGARVARFPVAGNLPRYNGGSVSASIFSRPARCLMRSSPLCPVEALTPYALQRIWGLLGYGLRAR